MKAVVIHEHGGLDHVRVEELAEPRMGQNEVILQVRSASLNHLDIWIRKGRPGLKHQIRRCVNWNYLQIGRRKKWLLHLEN